MCATFVDEHGESKHKCEHRLSRLRYKTKHAQGRSQGGAKGAFAPPFFQKDKSFIYI